MGPAGWQKLPETFEVSGEAATARLQRRLTYVVRQLEWRIEEADRVGSRLDEARTQLEWRVEEAARMEAAVEDAHAQLDRLRQELDARTREADAWRRAYEATMATKTMRAARVPRALYARVRGRQ